LQEVTPPLAIRLLRHVPILAPHCGFVAGVATGLRAQDRKVDRANESCIAPGLIHHHFSNKEELLTTLLQTLMGTFRIRVATYEERGDPLLAYIDGALALDDTEVEAIRRRSDYELSDQDAGAVLAFVVGSLVVGAFAPRKTSGFAAPGLRTLVAALRSARVP